MRLRRFTRAAALVSVLALLGLLVPFVLLTIQLLGDGSRVFQ